MEEDINHPFQIIPTEGTDEEGDPMFLRLNIGGAPFILLVDAILRAESTGFLAKFVQLTHPSRCQVSFLFCHRIITVFAYTKGEIITDFRWLMASYGTNRPTSSSDLPLHSMQYFSIIQVESSIDHQR